MSFLSDDFSSVGSGADLSTSTAAAWSKNTGSAENAAFLGDASNAVYNSGGGGGIAQYTCTDKLPATADYTVECDIVVKSVTGNSTGIMARCNGVGNAFSGYALVYRPFQGCKLHRVDSGALTTLGTSNTGTTDPAPGSTIHLKLQLSGTTLTATVTGGMTGNWSATDATYAAKGTVGVYSGAAVTSTTGPHIDNVVGTDPVVVGSGCVIGSPIIQGATVVGSPIIQGRAA